MIPNAPSLNELPTRESASLCSRSTSRHVRGLWTSRCRHSAVVLSLLAATTAAAEGPSSTTAEIVARLLDEKPRRLYDLEAIIGPLVERGPDVEMRMPIPVTRETGSVEEIVVFFELDMYHEAPRQSNPRLGEWMLDFRQGCGAAFQLLEARFGHPTLVDKKRRFGDFFFRPWYGERCSLEWHIREPEWAKPTRPEEETAAIQKTMATLLSEADVSRTAVEEAFGPLLPNPGYGCDEIVYPTWKIRAYPSGAADPERIVISFDHDRPLPATPEILSALGITEPMVVADDVHGVLRELVDRDGFKRPRLGGKLIEVGVADEGLQWADDVARPGLAWRVSQPLLLSFEIQRDPRRK